MSIDHINSSILKHPVFSPNGDLIVHANKLSHVHRKQSNVAVPPVDSADFLQPAKDGLGKHLDIKT